MNVRTLCLAVLNSGDATGYEIRKLVSEGHFSHFVDASFGSIYPALKSMSDDQLVMVREVQQDGKPNRKVYSITDLGRAEFLSALTKPAQKDNYKSEFLLLAMCAEMMSLENVRAALDAQIEFLKEELSQIDSEVREIDLAGADWVANYGRACLSQGLEYIQSNRSALEDIAGTSLPNTNKLIAAE
jgi:DNA-binding PadR family transcriptional regulator